MNEEKMLVTKVKLFERWQYSDKESADGFELRINEFLTKHSKNIDKIDFIDVNHVHVLYEAEI